MTSTVIKRDQNTSTVNRNIREQTILSVANDNTHEVKMGLADDGLDILLDLLSDPSSDCGGYVLREAYSNAYDAVKEAGSGRIDIYLPQEPNTPNNLPTKLGYLVVSPNELIVSDTGCGMTTEQVEKCFIQYGGSTKRSDADAIGSKGLGALAPLSVCDSFSVESVKDGIKTSAVIERRAGGNWASVTTGKTDQPNGTVVRVPVHDELIVSQMKKCAERIANFTTEDFLYINGEHVTDTIEGFVFAGEIAVGENEDGNPNNFRIWVNSETFPVIGSENEWSIVIGGYPYANPNGWRISYFIEGEPGYLNFNLSRDEIKQDAAYRRFETALRKAAAAFRVSDEIFEQCADNQSDFFAWVAKNPRLELACENDTLVVSDTRTDNKWSVPNSVMDAGDGSLRRVVKEHKTYALADTDNSGFNIWGKPKDRERCAMYSPKKKDMKEHGLALVPVPVELIDNKACGGRGSGGSFKRIPTVIISECDQDIWKALATHENALRKHFGSESYYGVRYLLDYGTHTPCDADKMLLGNVYYLAQSEMAKVARSTKTKNTKKRTRKDIDISKEVASLYSVDDNGHVLCWDKRQERFDKGYADMSDCALVIGNVSNRYTVHSAFELAVATGLTDKRVLVNLVNTNVANMVVDEMIARGAQVFVDVRRRDKRYASLLDGFATWKSYYYDRKRDNKVTCCFAMDALPKSWVRDNALDCVAETVRDKMTSGYNSADAVVEMFPESADGEIGEALGYLREILSTHHRCSTNGISFDCENNEFYKRINKLISFSKKYDLGSIRCTQASLDGFIRESIGAKLAQEWDTL